MGSSRSLLSNAPKNITNGALRKKTFKKRCPHRDEITSFILAPGWMFRRFTFPFKVSSKAQHTSIPLKNRRRQDFCLRGGGGSLMPPFSGLRGEEVAPRYCCLLYYNILYSFNTFEHQLRIISTVVFVKNLGDSGPFPRNEHLFGVGRFPRDFRISHNRPTADGDLIFK